MRTWARQPTVLPESPRRAGGRSLDQEAVVVLLQDGHELEGGESPPHIQLSQTRSESFRLQIESHFEFSWGQQKSPQIIALSECSQESKKQSIDCPNQRVQGNEDSIISEFRKTGRAARSIPRPLGRGAPRPFNFHWIIIIHSSKNIEATTQSAECGLAGALQRYFCSFAASAGLG